MAPLLISIRHVILFLIFFQSTSLYKIYTLDDNQSDLSNDLLSSSLNDNMNQVNSQENLEYDDENKDNSPLWLSLVSQLNEQQQSLRKRSLFSIGSRSSKPLPQRRNNRPHWNPLVAAYKRCGELSRREERESCFKDAIQMLFVHKLRK